MNYFSYSILFAIMCLTVSPLFALDGIYTVDLSAEIVQGGGSSSAAVDCSGKINQAILTAHMANGGVVQLPAGEIYLKNPVIIKQGVILEGVGAVEHWSGFQWPSNVPAPYSSALASKRTWLKINPTNPCNDSASATAAAIQMEGKSGLRNIAFINTQDWKQNNTPNEKPYTIAVLETDWTYTDGVILEGIFLANSYRGILLHGSQFGSGRHVLRKIGGNPLKIGISVDASRDTGRMSDVHFWPYSTGATGEKANWVRDNGVAIQFRGNDWEIVNDIVVFGYGVGMQFVESLVYNPDTSNYLILATNGQFSNINFDQCNVGLDVWATQEFGITISGLNCAVGGYGSIKRAVWMHSSLQPFRNVTITGGAFWTDPNYLQNGFLNEIIRNESGMLQISNSSFRAWQTGQNFSAITLTGGARAIITGNFFQDSLNLSRRSVYIDSNCDRVIISGNLMPGCPVVAHPSHPSFLRTIANNNQ